VFDGGYLWITEVFKKEHPVKQRLNPAYIQVSRDSCIEPAFMHLPGVDPVANLKESRNEFWPHCSSFEDFSFKFPRKQRADREGDGRLTQGHCLPFDVIPSNIVA
jgi:hypothetical protein